MSERAKKGGTPGKAAGANAARSARTKQPKRAVDPKVKSHDARKKNTFTLHAPEATRVFVAGSFNDWDPAATPLERGEGGTWTCAVVLDPGEHEYRFIVDGVWWDDPSNARRRQTEFGCENCILIV